MSKRKPKARTLDVAFDSSGNPWFPQEFDEIPVATFREVLPGDMTGREALEWVIAYLEGVRIVDPELRYYYAQIANRVREKLDSLPEDDK